MVSLYFGLNLLLSISKGLSYVSNASCSVWVIDSNSCRHCMLSHILIMGPLSALLILYFCHIFYILFEVPQLSIFVCGAPVKCQLLHDWFAWLGSWILCSFCSGCSHGFYCHSSCFRLHYCFTGIFLFSYHLFYICLPVSETLVFEPLWWD